MDDELDLFVEAQDTVWGNVILELTMGRKKTHWMWFVFPQLAELGESDMAQLYGIHDLNEARDYLAHPTLGPRLSEVAALVMTHAGTSPETIFGSTDAMKLCSSMTLFSAIPDADPVFAGIIDTFFDGRPCSTTASAVG